MLSAFLQEQNRVDSQRNSHGSYLDLVMSDVCCENKSKKVNSDIMQEILSVSLSIWEDGAGLLTI